MAPLRIFIAAALHFSVGGVVKESSPKISAVTALLPPRSSNGAFVGARMRLEAWGGCYSWSSKKPELVEIELNPPKPEEDEDCLCSQGPCRDCLLFGDGIQKTNEEVSCQSVVYIRVVADESMVGTDARVHVIAKDHGALDVELRCEVYLRSVARVEVETRSRRIGVDDVEALAARAYDSQGNVFSSLEGLEFAWTIRNVDVLNELPAEESALHLSQERRAVVTRGSQSDLLLVRGTSTGHTDVEVKLLGPGRTVVAVSPQVRLAVAETLLISPSFPRVMPWGVLQFGVKALRGPRRSLEQLPDVPLPTKYLKWEAHDTENPSSSSVLTIFSDTARSVAMKIGKSHVRVVDQRIENNTAEEIVEVSEPTALNVVQIPASGFNATEDGEWNRLLLKLSAPAGPRALVSSDEQSWFLVRGRVYLMALEIQNAAGHSLMIPSNFRSEFLCNGGTADAACPLRVLRHPENTAVVAVEAHSLGKGTLGFKNASVVSAGKGMTGKSWPNIHTQIDFEVVDSLSLDAPFSGPVVLPPDHSYRLKVYGGSGSFHFAVKGVSPPFDVSEDGEIHAGSVIGSGIIIVSDGRGAANALEIPVWVRELGMLALLPPAAQLPLVPEDGTSNFIVTLAARPAPADTEHDDAVLFSKLRFWSCSGISSSSLGRLYFMSSETEVAMVEIQEDAVADPKNLGVCATAAVRPVSLGVFTLIAEVGSALRTDVSLRVYPALKSRWQVGEHEAEYPTAEAVLAPGSSLRIEMVGGPGEETVPSKLLANLSTEMVSSHLQILRINERLYEVLCLQPSPGQIRLKAAIGSQPLDPETYGDVATSYSEAFVRCVMPAKVQIVPSGRAITAGPGGRGWALLGERKHLFRASMQSSDGHALTNGSSFPMEWALDAAALLNGWNFQKGHVLDGVSVEAPREGSAQFNVSVKKLLADECIKWYGLDSHRANALKASSQSFSGILGDEVKLAVVQDLTVTWPGSPASRFVFAPHLGFAFKAAGGSGAVNLTVDAEGDSSKVRFVESDELCSNQHPVIPGCIELLEGKSIPAGTSKRWLLRPTSQGAVRIVIDDPALLGGHPVVVSATFLPVTRITVGIQGMAVSSEAVSIAQDQKYSISVEVYDSDGGLVPPAQWRGAKLRLESSDLMIIADPEGEYHCIAKGLGVFQLKAVMLGIEGSEVVSNDLQVRVFPPLQLVPPLAVVVAGTKQQFELALEGGPFQDPSMSATVSTTLFKSSNETVARIDTDGLVHTMEMGTSVFTVTVTESSTGRELAQAAAKVVVAVPESLVLEPTSVSFVVRGAVHPSRIRAALYTAEGLEFTPSLLAAPSGKAGQTETALSGCHFQWSQPDAELRDVFMLGAEESGAVSVNIKAGKDSHPGKSFEIGLDVTIPSGRKFAAQKRLTIRDALQLLKPYPDSSQTLRLPPFGRIPLVFSVPYGQLKLRILEPAGEVPPVQLVEGPSLLAGADEGAALLTATPTSDDGDVPALTLNILVRRPRAVRLWPPPSHLPLHASATVEVLLLDEEDRRLVIPPNYPMIYSPSSHGSLLKITHAPDGPLGTLHLRAAAEGCVALEASIGPPKSGTQAGIVLRDQVAPLCILSGALLYQGPVHVQPGGHVHFSIDAARDSVSTYAASEGIHARAYFTLAVRLRSGDPAGEPNAVAAQFVAELTQILGLQCGPTVSLSLSGSFVEVAFRVNAAGLPHGEGPAEIAERIWYHSGLWAEKSVTRHLDLAYGIRAAPKLDATQDCSHCAECCGRAVMGSVGPSVGAKCPGGDGWRSSSQTVLQVDSNTGEAVAKTPGNAVVTSCRAGVVSETQIIVAPVADIRFGEAPKSVTNAGTKAGAPAAVLTLRLFVDGGRGLQELRSGPFWAQRIRVVCRSNDTLFDSFFHFEGVDLASRAEGAAVSGLPEWGSASPQVACILWPRETNVQQWERYFPPKEMTLQIVVGPEGSEGDRPSGGFLAEKTLQLPFVPQFALLDSYADGVGPHLTAAARQATVKVWTGGQQIHVVVHQQLTAGQGQLLVERLPSQGSHPIASFLVTWDSPRAAAPVMHSSLRFACPSNGQEQILKVKVSGGDQGAAPEVHTEESRSVPVGVESASLGGNWLLAGLVGALGLAVILRLDRSASSGKQVHMRDPAVVAATRARALCTQPGTGLGHATPFRRVVH